MEPSTNPDRPDPVKPADPPHPPAAREEPAPSANGTPPGPAGEAAAPPPPLTPMAWLRNNSIYLLVIAALVVWLYRNTGMSGVLNAAIAVLGVSFVIFVHELGHFLAAKWCDVHVTTFSIGFGPAIPGCSFQRGETTYKVGILPLGGYVAMVGEGPEADENEDYPRSFKNKSVGARMLIISAGVIMNLILGCICFIVLFNHGQERAMAAVWRLDPGSPAWVANVPVGSTIVRIGNVKDPTFDDLKNAVMLSGYGEEIEFVFKTRGGREITRKLVPRRDANDMVPVIGVSPPLRLKLPGDTFKRVSDLPVRADSPAAAARPVGLRPGDEVLEATDPDAPQRLTKVKDLSDLCARMRRLIDKKLVLKVRRGGAEGAVETVEVPAAGFEFDDVIVATSYPAKDPFDVTNLPVDPAHAADKTFHGDPYEFRHRMRLLAGKPAVIEVERKGGGRVRLLVPPAFHRTLGLRMRMGTVAAVRDGSPAAQAGVTPPAAPGQVGDVLTGVKMTFPDQTSQTWTDLDPVRLPDQLAEAARRHRHPDTDKKTKVTLSVLRRDQHKDTTVDLTPVEWDDAFDDSAEEPATPSSPMSIPQLGLAYFIKSEVMDVEAGGPGAGARRVNGDGGEPVPILVGDVLEAIRYRISERDPHSGQMVERWSSWLEMKAVRGSEKAVFDEWAYFFRTLQDAESPRIEVRVRRADRVLEGVELTAKEDPTWPLEERGLILRQDMKLEKGENLWQSLMLGVGETKRFVVSMYLQLRSLLTNRISTKALGGPVAIASAAFYLADDPYRFLWFMGMLSINLAVLNFLPIPILDGGHMVFLLYEWLRGKPPSETIRAIATYVGLALLLSLMVFVTWQDIWRAFGFR